MFCKIYEKVEGIIQIVIRDEMYDAKIQGSHNYVLSIFRGNNFKCF